MSEDRLDEHLLPSVDLAVKNANRVIHDFALHVHLRHWHPISTAPCNQDLELRVAEGGAILTLEFPCRQTNAGDWIDVDLGTRTAIKPVEWRVWQHSKSPQPHHASERDQNTKFSRTSVLKS